MWVVCLALTATKSPLGYSLGLDSTALADDTEVRGSTVGSAQGAPLARAAGHHACPLFICFASLRMLWLLLHCFLLSRE